MMPVIMGLSCSPPHGSHYIDHLLKRTSDHSSVWRSMAHVYGRRFVSYRMHMSMMVRLLSMSVTLLSNSRQNQL
jgi:hypothetical protein